MDRIGFIGVGDQGRPMAQAIAAGGFELHLWARRPSSLDGIGGVVHRTAGDLASAVDVVALCVSTDEDVLRIVGEEVLPSLRAGSVVVNHGTGTPGNARLLADLCQGKAAPAGRAAKAAKGVQALDAPVSGGRPAAEARTLTTLVGGGREAFERCAPVFRTYGPHVLHLGGPGAGQTAKLFNNALLMMNQAAIADLLTLAAAIGQDPVRLVGALRHGSATSAALTLLNTMVTPDTVGHLSAVEALDMDLFAAAMRDAGVDAAEATARGRDGARRLPEVIKMLNP